MGSYATPINVGAAQAGIGAFGALSQNAAIRRSGRSAADATGVELEQIDDARDLEIRKRAAESQAIRARYRVLAADSGFEFNGSFAALERQVGIDEEINRSIVERNAFNQRRRSLSELSSLLTRLAGGAANPGVAAFQGGLSGYQTGLQIQGARGDPGERFGFDEAGPSAGRAYA